MAERKSFQSLGFAGPGSAGGGSRHQTCNMESQRCASMAESQPRIDQANLLPRSIVMNTRLTIMFVAGALSSLSSPALAQTGIFAQSNYTHDPNTGFRTPQYAPNAPSIAPPGINYQVSGYRFLQSNIRGAGGGIDRQIFVEQWGNGQGLRDAQAERDFQAFQQPFYGRTPDGRSYSLPGYGWPGYNFPLVPQVTGGFWPGVFPFGGNGGWNGGWNGGGGWGPGPWRPGPGPWQPGPGPGPKIWAQGEIGSISRNKFGVGGGEQNPIK